MNGRPSENGKASVSMARGDSARARSGAQPRGTYEADAQALADIWDPKKRKEREEAAAAEAAAAEAARVAQEKAAREQRERAAREAAAAATRKRLAALPEIDAKPAVDPSTVPSIVAEVPEAKSEPEAKPADDVAMAPSEVDEFDEQGEDELEPISFDAETTADLPLIGPDGRLLDGSEEEYIDEEPAPRNRPTGKPVRRKPGQKGGTSSRKSTRKKGSSSWKVVLVVFAVLLVLVGSVAAYLGLNRWVLVDDEKDFQGSWHLSGQPVSVVISETEMDMAGKVVYAYTLDTKAKVVTETLGNMEGSSRYRFAEDRNSVAIFDDGSSDWWGNALIDFQWYASALFAKLTGGKAPDLLGGESGVILYRAGYDAPSVVTSTAPVEPASNTQAPTGNVAPDEGTGAEEASESEEDAESAPSDE